MVELFTSQGCSSCPAADKLLASWRAIPRLSTMTLPVDYWDYLGWKDTLALHGHTNRQRAYSHARGDRKCSPRKSSSTAFCMCSAATRRRLRRAIAQSREGAVKPLLCR